MTTSKAYNRDLVEVYDHRHFGGRSGHYILMRDCTILAALLPKAPARVLDIPCGTGAYTAKLVNHGYEVVAADASEPMLETTADRNTGATTRLCSIHDLPFDEDFFDATVTLRLFSHFDRDETERALRELRRVVRPGGRVVFDSFRWTPRRWPIVRHFMDQGHIREIAPTDVETMIHQVGLRLVARESHYLFSPIWQRKLPFHLLRALTSVEAILPDRWLLRTFWACSRDADQTAPTGRSLTPTSQAGRN